MAKYVGIKRDTTFPIIVGGNTLINFQKLLLFLLADKTEEEIKEAYDKIIKKEFDEEWYEHYAFLALMINHIETVARQQGLTVEEELTSEEPS
jgi:hypothetical protein